MNSTRFNCQDLETVVLVWKNMPTWLCIVMALFDIPINYSSSISFCAISSDVFIMDLVKLFRCKNEERYLILFTWL